MCGNWIRGGIVILAVVVIVAVFRRGQRLLLTSLLDYCVGDASTDAFKMTEIDVDVTEIGEAGHQFLRRRNVTAGVVHDGGFAATAVASRREQVSGRPQQRRHRPRPRAAIAASLVAVCGVGWRR